MRRARPCQRALNKHPTSRYSSKSSSLGITFVVRYTEMNGSPLGRRKGVFYIQLCLEAAQRIPKQLHMCGKPAFPFSPAFHLCPLLPSSLPFFLFYRFSGTRSWVLKLANTGVLPFPSCHLVALLDF